MSNTPNNNQESTANPAIRVFQFDSNSEGAIKKSVNLFRGDVNLPLSLVTLPGRNKFDVNIKILAQSNVHEEVDAWNLSSPTGILGLGWTMPIEKIVLNTQYTGSDTYKDYSLSSGSSNQQLVPSSVKWLRLNLPASDASQLDAGGAPTKNILQSFATEGIILDASSTITVQQAGTSWSISDPVNQTLYDITSNGDQLEVYDGGQAFQSKSYQFWRIRYYEVFNRWAITRDDGRTSSFGGIANGTGNGSLRNSIEWGVRWGIWSGSSELIKDNDEDLAQQQYARTWHITTLTDSWGETIQYDYEVMEQAVGTGGLNYTKASYLKKITDTFKREIIFNYAKKVYDSASPSGIREYADPHKLFPNETPNAYQDSYETCFLDNLEIHNEHAQLLYTINLSYALKNVSIYKDTDPIYGDTYKRYLTAMTLVEADGGTMPGMLFAYDWSQDPSANRGAINKVTYPQGGSANYTYEKATIDTISRDYKIDNPFPSQAKPRTWFGKDYVVSTWYLDSRDNPELKLSIYTWVAGWQKWEADIPEFKHTIDLNTLEVVAKDDFFILYFNSIHSEAYQSFFFHKNENTFSQWLAYQPTDNTFGTKPIRVVAGDRYGLIAYQDGSNNEQFKRYTWDLDQHQWIEENLTGAGLCQEGLATSNSKFYAVGKKNYYAVLCYDTSNNGKNQLQWFYHDYTGKWYQAGITQPQFAIASTGGNNTYFNMVASDTCIVTAVITSFGSSPSYSTFIFQWDAQFANILTTRNDGNLKKFVPIGPNIAADSIVGFGPKGFRYNGNSTQANEATVEGWLSQELPILLQGVTDQSKVYRWTAAGPDYLLQSANGPQGATIQLASYDPDTDVSSWKTALQIIDNESKAEDYRAFRFFVSSGGEDYFTANDKVYFRITSQQTNWSDIKDHQIYQLGQELTDGLMVNTTTIQNNAPYFIAYGLEKTGDSYGTSIVSLRNGQVIKDASGQPIVNTFAGQYLFEIFDAKQGKVRSNVNGRVSRGPLSFYTSPVEDIDQSPSITIYRFAQQGVVGALSDFRVKTVQINDGYDTQQYYYDYDDATAGFDPSGKIAKYFKVTSYPGAASVDTASNGQIVTEYFNGLAAAIAGNQNSATNYTILDGLLHKQTSYNQAQQIISSHENTWTVYDQIMVKKDIKDPGTMKAIYGNWVRITKMDLSLDTVPQTIEKQYDPSTGLLTTESTSYYDSTGQATHQKKELTYGGNVYPWLFQHNLIKTQIQTKILLGDQVFKVKAVPFQAWSQKTTDELNLDVYAPAGEFAWRGGTGSSDFDFINWTPASALPTWRPDSLYLKRNANGLITESTLGGGQNNSVGFSKDAELSVYTAQNARLSLEEVAYYGFEAYESNPGWTIAEGTNTVQGIAHTGTTSLALTAGTTDGLKASFSPANTQQDYVFYCWYRTAEDFSPSSGSGISIEQASSANDRPPQAIPFENTKGNWVFLAGKIELSDGALANDAVTISISASNSASQMVYIDNLFFGPAIGSITATVYDATYRLPLATVGPWNHVTREVHNRYLNKVAEINAAGAVASLNLPFLSRNGSAGNDQFDKTAPNSHSILDPMGTGYYLDFRRDPDWQNQWSATSGNWQIIDGELQSTDDTAANLKAIQKMESQGIYLQINPKEKPLTAPLGISMGQLKVQWDPIAKVWQLQENGQKVLEQAAVNFQQDICISTLDKSVFVWLDGQLTFSYQFQNTIDGEINIFTGNKIGLSQLLVFSNPKIKINYANGLGKIIQFHSLSSTDQSLLGVNLYDSLDRKTVFTKTPIFKASSDHPALIYRPTAVTAMDWDTGIMQGDIADALPDDEGYPYYRNLFEAAPNKRVIEKGLPGKDFAITDLNSTPPDSRHTTKFMYAANHTEDTFADSGIVLPTGQYYLRTSIDPNGVQSSTIQDTQGGQIASNIVVGPDSSHTITSSGTNTIDQEGMFTSKFFMPTYYDESIAEHENFVVQQIFDPLGLARENISPDSKKVTFIYDDAGRLRFMQDAKGADGQLLGQPYINYVKYDELGRKTETGIVPFDWGDGSSLSQMAEKDPNFPTSGQTATKTFHYGSDISPVNQFGRLVKIINNKIIGEKTSVSAELTYDIIGNTIEHQEIVEQYDQGQAFVMQYNYNNQKQVVLTEYLLDQEQSSYTVQYQYNQHGQIIAVEGGEGQLSTLSNFQYNGAGMIDHEVIHPGQPNEITRQLFYNSPGWLKKIDNDLFSEEITYISNGYNGAGFYNQNIASTSCKFTGIADPGTFIEEIDYLYDYDRLDRLTVAECKNQGNTLSDFSLGLNTQPVVYDNNGNILAITLGDQTEHYQYNEGTDQLVTNGQQSQALSYNLNGEVSSAKIKQITAIDYGPNNHLAEHLEKADGTNFEIAYLSKNRRAWKKSSAGTEELYVYGMSPFPVMQESSANGSKTRKLYIHGPTGLLIIKTDTDAFTLLKDHEGSTRALVNSQKEIVAAYNYLPFGAFLGDTYLKEGISKDLCVNLFSGQEYDWDFSLYNDRARLYDPELRIFYGTDPKAKSISPYIYGQDNPITYIDITGESSNIFGIIFSSLEIAAGVLSIPFGGGAISYGLIVNGAMGLTYSIRADQNFSVGNFFKVQVSAGISQAEIAAAITIDILSAGTLSTTVGAALLGAGVSGLLNTGQQVILGDKGEFSMGSFFEDQAIGFVSGVITAGFGSAGGIVGKALTQSAQKALSASAAKVAEVGIRVGVSAVAGALGGAGAAATKSGIDALFSNKKFDFNAVGTGALYGLAVGATVGAVGVKFGGKENPELTFKQKHIFRKDISLTKGLVRLTGPLGFNSVKTATTIDKWTED